MSEWILVHSLTKLIYSESRGDKVITTQEPMAARKFPLKINATECIRFNSLAGYAPVELDEKK